MEDPAESWTSTLVAEAAAIHEDRIARPELAVAHVWRDGRVDAGWELTAPLAVELDGGGVLGIAGDGLHAAGGLEGAYLSGIALATRLVEMLPRRP
ncbi:MAG: hypothetical protein A2V63_10060 [Candidatus Eisenbacteria bacterium RBG_19FT_COMBO_70_11]|nr:MAG: hypothetical protein A2V63_10060 [Candidatus Eisenbacteria bacterium RBG_19FT_COMBO_70_11]